MSKKNQKSSRNMKEKLRASAIESRPLPVTEDIGGSVMNFDADTSTVFDEQQSGYVPTRVERIGGKDYQYVMWGDDDQMPYMMRNKVGDNMITAQCQFFNAQTAYGQGLRFFDKANPKMEAKNDALDMFDLINNLKQQYMEMCTDMVNYYFAVVVFILDKQGKNIVHVHAKEAQNCRFTLDRKHIIYGNFENGADVLAEKELIPWLDINHPAEDFLIRTGVLPDPRTGICQQSKERKFAMVCRFPTVGFQWYPRPTWVSILRDHWYDIYSLIGQGKKTKIKNTTAPRHQVEILKDFWDDLCDQEGVFDPQARQKFVAQKKKEINDYVTGVNNAGKAWITSAEITPNGTKVSAVEVKNLEGGKKEGGDWADDIQEASNILCFALGVHPNLIGATPGKAAMNNSGSDKRELFTLKQALMTPFRDSLLQPWKLILYYNGYDNVGVEIPIMQLTTLDENKDVKKVSTNGNQEGGNE